LGLVIASAGGIVAAVLVVVLAHRHVERAAPLFPLAPPAPRIILKDVPETLRLGPPVPPAGAFAKVPKPSIPLPNLNSEAHAILGDLNGRWSDGETQLFIDADRFRGRLGRDVKAPFQPIIVRDVTNLMTTLDIGPQRFVLLRRPDSVAIGGATLAAPLELHRVR
jgi:hypothetical protein